MAGWAGCGGGLFTGLAGHHLTTPFPAGQTWVAAAHRKSSQGKRKSGEGRSQEGNARGDKNSGSGVLLYDLDVLVLM